MIRELPASTYVAVDRAMGRVITLFVDSVDSALEAVPNPIPSGGQLRTTRANSRENLTAGVNRLRKPVLAGIGAADWLAERLVLQPRGPGSPQIESAQIESAQIGSRRIEFQQAESRGTTPDSR